MRPWANSSMALRISSLVLDVDGAGGLVQDQDRGIAEHRPRQGDPLALAAGKTVSAFADHGVVAVGQCHDELVGIGSLGGFDDRARGWRCGSP